MTDTIKTSFSPLQETISSSIASQKTRSVCIVIPTYKAEPYLRSLLDAIIFQRTPGYQFEILLVDSSSPDATKDIAAGYKKIRCHSIDQKKFTHPGTRNLAVTMTDAEYIVFLTQDALPENDSWLRELLKPFEHWPDLAATYSRQIPRENCNPLEARDVRAGAPLIDELRYLDLRNSEQMKEYRGLISYFIRFSNVSACYRADLLRANPFNERLEMVEDQEWSKRMLEKGHAIYYAAKSVVAHSHEFNSKQIYQRNFDYGRSFKKFMPDNGAPAYPWKLALWNIFQDFLLIAFCRAPLLWKIKWILLSAPRRLSACQGFRQGWKRG